MDFKTQVMRDIKEVFHNSAEHAETLEFWIEGTRFEIPVVLDSTGAQDRAKPSSDHVDGIFVSDLVMYVSLNDLRQIPKRGQQVEIKEDVFTIDKVDVEAGEVILHLEMLDE